MKIRRFEFSIVCLVAWLATGGGSRSVADDFRVAVAPFLEEHCLECHSESTQEARIRLDIRDGFLEEDRQLWTRVHQVLLAGEMPPDHQPRPASEEKKRVLEWIENAQRTSGGNGTRRLNRRELSAALSDLTGLPIDFAAGLPGDGLIDGFDTGAAGLQDAADSVAQHLEVSRRAVESIRFLEPDRQRNIAIDFREHEFNDFRKFVDQNWNDEGIFTRTRRLSCFQGVGAYLPTQWTGERGNSFLAVPAPPDKRAALSLRLRVFAKRPMPGLPIPTLWVSIGDKYVDYVSIDEKPRDLEYAVRMEDHLVEDGVIKVMLRCFVEMPYSVEGFENDDRSKPEDHIPGGIGVYRPRFDRKELRTPDVQPVPAIVIESIAIDYDHRVPWPPANWEVDLGKIEDNDASARRLLKLWVDRAWRRPTSNGEREKFFVLYRKLRDEGHSFDDALRAAFQSVLMGGPFRFFASPSDRDSRIAHYAIASRLSFMLVGAPPDKELRRLAAEKRLRDPDVLDSQVDRLLDDPRRDEFFRPFVTQWLNMNQPITLTMSHFKKQDFRFARHLKASMQEETVQYVARLFAENRPAGELVASDWTVMNDILANYYGYDALEGGRMRKVRLRESDPRGGGILSHAGIQSMLCWMGDNWVIYRGSWTLNHMLDDPPPPPPLDVPELDPSGKENHGKSFRELLVEHQAHSDCASCHRKIDPIGFAFQNFDLSGRWRDVEHERYHRYELDGKIEWRGEGQTRPVDCVGRLPRGDQFASFREFQETLLEQYLDDIVRGLLKKLTLYGTGRQADVGDLASIRLIMGEQSKSRYTLRDVLKALVRSRTFLGIEAKQGVSP